MQLGSSGTGFFGCSCLPKAVTGVSQPGVGLESAYSGPRVELRPPVNPSPVFAPLPPHPQTRIYRGEGRGVLLRILGWNAYVTCMHGGVVPACLPPWPTRRCPLSDLLISASATLVHFTPLGMATVGVPM